MYVAASQAFRLCRKDTEEMDSNTSTMTRNGPQQQSSAGAWQQDNRDTPRGGAPMQSGTLRRASGGRAASRPKTTTTWIGPTGAAVEMPAAVGFRVFAPTLTAPWMWTLPDDPRVVRMFALFGASRLAEGVIRGKNAPEAELSARFGRITPETWGEGVAAGRLRDPLFELIEAIRSVKASQGVGFDEEAARRSLAADPTLLRAVRREPLVVAELARRRAASGQPGMLDALAAI